MSESTTFTEQSSGLSIEATLEPLSAENLIKAAVESVFAGESNLDIVKTAEQKIEAFVEETLDGYMDLSLQHKNAKDRAKFLLAFNQVFQVVKTELVRVGLKYSKSRVADLGEFIDTKAIITSETDKLKISEEEKATYLDGILSDCNSLWDSHEEFSNNFITSLKKQFQTTFEQLDTILAEVQTEKVIQPAGASL